MTCTGNLPAEWRAETGLRDGLDVYAALMEWAGETSWPDTYWVQTPSGGWHLYYREGLEPIRNSAGLLGPGVDVRGQGGYVIAAGSATAAGAYEMLNDAAPAPLPPWLSHRLLPPPAPRRQAHPGALRDGDAGRRLAGLEQHVRDGVNHDRNGRLHWAACRLGEMVAAGQADPDDGEILVEAALAAGLRGGEPEARRALASGLRAGSAR